jgi:predicted phosphodiesterase
MRALILSDIHGNLEALEAVLEDAGAVDTVWNLGDVVGYGASPNEVVERIRRVATASVRGNHDKACSGVVSPSNFNSSARDAARAWLAALPGGPLVVSHGNVALAHGSPVHEDIYILNIRDAWVPLQQMQEQVTFFGHTHVQGGFGWCDGRWFEVPAKHSRANGSSEVTLQLEAGRRYLVNPGSVGQPRDGDWRAAYALFDTVSNALAFRRVAYDLTLAQGRILMAGLPERLAARLREGR